MQGLGQAPDKHNPGQSSTVPGTVGCISPCHPEFLKIASRHPQPPNFKRGFHAFAAQF